MVNKCSAFGCTSGYVTEQRSDSEQKVTFHAYPLHDKDLCDKWIKANPCKDFVPSKHSKLCSLHFRESDFISKRTDSNAARRKRKSAVCEQPLRRHLLPGAVPSIFTNVPEYLSTPKAPSRTTTSATSASRRERETLKLQQLEESFSANDDISALTLSDIQAKLESETAVPDGYCRAIISSKLLLCLLDVDGDVPQLAACITLHMDLKPVVSVSGKLVSKSHYKDLLTGDAVKQISQLVNLMARVKSWATAEDRSMSRSLAVDMAVNSLKAGLDHADDDEGDKCDEKTKFIVEQLQLLERNKFGRHYSPRMIIISYMIYAASSAAYKTLLNSSVLSLPSVSTLKKVTKRLDTKTGLDNTAYLQLRIAKLTEYERTVVLIIDEIYVAKRVEYSGGDIRGLTADGSVASTLLCFMVKSLTSKYKDIVAIYPISKLTADIQHRCYNEVMALLRKVLLNVVAISVDNASTNRKFFVDCLCEGKLKTHITDAETGQPIYLIFDPVHDLKNLYNNFQSRKVFHCPPMPPTLPTGCTAQFHHIVELHTMESGMLLKKAHRLTPATIKPKSIEKTSVKLATSVFSESTCDALRFYADNEDKAEWTSTADFLSFVIKLWNVMNVKSRAKGRRKRDITMDPIRSSMDWKLEFLRECADFLQRWEDSGKPGLTRETFLALRHTCLSLADCASYLLDHRGMNYVLLGHLQSDAIERRFGWLRQLSGANYYISMRQVLESDRKIRALSLLKFSAISLTDIDDKLQSGDVHSAEDSLADTISDLLKFNTLPSASDANIILYVSGFMARSVYRVTKCEHCKESLVTSEALEPLDVSEELDYSASTFLDAINRGGLTKPTDFTFSVVVEFWRVFQEIKSTPNLLKEFLTAASHQLLFCKVMDRVAYIQTSLHIPVESNICVNGHDLNNLLARRFFNCVAKNLAKEFTASATDNSGRKRRKILKLQSTSH